jgi:hypothetical protein
MVKRALVIVFFLANATAAFQSALLRASIPRPLTSLSSTTPTDREVSSSNSIKPNSNKKVSVLLCPAQFCVPADYEELFDNIRKTRTERIANGENLPAIGTCRVSPLPRTEWIKVARQLPTRNFLDATLSAKTTLGWYFDAMEQALSDIYAIEGPNVNVCIIAHSIGGWVARGYLGGLAR